MRRRLLLAGIAASILVLGDQVSAAPITVDTVATADTFVRQNAPDTTYGTRGGLSVAGSSALNGSGSLVGLADTFMRFNLASAVASLDSQFGNHNWTITDVTLRLVEYTTPANNDFGRGQGQFDTRWIAADNWGENALTWNTKGSYLSAASDVAAGTFTNLLQGDQYTPIQRFSLTLADSLVNDIRAGGDVSFYLTADSSAIGFTPNSKDITGTRPKPYLEITASPVPEPGTMALLMLGLPMLVGLRKRHAH